MTRGESTTNSVTMPFGVVGLLREESTHSTFSGTPLWRWWRRWRFREYFRRFLRRRLCFGRHGAKRCRLACFRRNYSRASGIRRRKGDQVSTSRRMLFLFRKWSGIGFREDHVLDLRWCRSSRIQPRFHQHQEDMPYLRRDPE